MRSTYGTPYQIAGVWAELTRQLTRCPFDARREFFMDAAARLVRIVFPYNHVIHRKNTFFNERRSFVYGGLYDRLSLAGKSSLEPDLFTLPTIGDWTQSRYRTDVD